MKVCGTYQTPIPFYLITGNCFTSTCYFTKLDKAEKFSFVSDFFLLYFLVLGVVTRISFCSGVENVSYIHDQLFKQLSQPRWNVSVCCDISIISRLRILEILIWNDCVNLHFHQSKILKHSISQRIDWRCCCDRIFGWVFLTVMTPNDTNVSPQIFWLYLFKT